MLVCFLLVIEKGKNYFFIKKQETFEGYLERMESSVPGAIYALLSMIILGVFGRNGPNVSFVFSKCNAGVKIKC